MKLPAVLLTALVLAGPGVVARRRTTRRSTTTTTTTTTTESTITGLTEYAQEVLTAAQEAMGAGTCGGRPSECSTSCYGDTESVYIEYTDDEYRYVIANGIPSHAAGEGAQRPNRNAACEIRSYMKVPIDVAITGYTQNGMGAIGIAVSGAFIYNPLSNPDLVDDVAVLNEGISFDNCDGHADSKCSYHYHEGVSCASDGSDCSMVGYLRDGVPVYSYCTVDGVQLQSCYQQTSGDGNSSLDYEWIDSDDCHLDVNNGYTFSDGSYGYVLTDSFPYTPPGYMGTPSDYCTF